MARQGDGGPAVPPSPPGRQRPTMTDVAVRAGFSRQLVSLVLRGAAGASPQTRERVLQAAAELGYSPDIAARTLRRRTSAYLGVVFTPAHSSESDVVEHMYSAAAAAGYGVVLSALTPARDQLIAIQELLGYRSEALILIGTTMIPADLRSLGRRVPVVTVGGGPADLAAGVDVVRSAGDQGIAQSVEHLVALGHRDIAFVHTPDMPSSTLRQQGYVRAMRVAGLSPRAVTVAEGYTEDAGATAAGMLLAEDPLPTAVVTGNDQAGLGLVHALLRHGVRVPGDVSVTGFDDSRIARLSMLDLTSARQDTAEMSAMAVHAALRRIGDPGLPPGEFVTVPTLVVRGSTGLPRNGPFVRRRSGRRSA